MISIKFFLISLCAFFVKCEDISVIGSEYLHSAINDLKEERHTDYYIPGAVDNLDLYELLRLTTTTQVPQIERSDHFHINYHENPHNHHRYQHKPSTSLTIDDLHHGYQHKPSTSLTIEDLHQVYQPKPSSSFTVDDLRPVYQPQNTHSSHSIKEDNPQSYQQQNQQIPSLSLTKGELLALYDSALQNGNVLNSDSNTVVHELPENYHESSNDHSSSTENNKVNGYYYYYYPLKSLLEDINNSTSLQSYSNHVEPQNTVHSHTHLHNVKIHSSVPVPVSPFGVVPPFGVMPPQQPKNKALEPLFMAISSFMGMAMMFLFSMVFLPQFRQVPKSRSGVKEDNIKTATISEIVFEAIEGHDCRERIYCEAGKMLYQLNLSDNRFLRFFQRLMPNKFSRSIDRIRQEAQKKRKCVLIQCKRKGNLNNKNNNSIHLKMQPKNVPQQKNKNTPNGQKNNNNNNKNGTRLKPQKKT